MSPSRLAPSPQGERIPSDFGKNFPSRPMMPPQPRHPFPLSDNSPIPRFSVTQRFPAPSRSGRSRRGDGDAIARLPRRGRPPLAPQRRRALRRGHLRGRQLGRRQALAPPKLAFRSDRAGLQRQLQSSSLRALMNTSPGTSTRPIDFIFFLPSFCFSSSLRLRVMSPP